jgi:amino acid adenylation domain-containing protein
VLTAEASGPVDGPDAPPSADRLVLAGLAAAPDSIAVIDGTHLVTAAGLRDRAERWAAELAARGIGPGRRVGVLLDRSAAHIAVALAVIRSGAAYLPIDPRLPESRIRGLLAQSRPDLLVADGRHPAAAGTTVVTPDDLGTRAGPRPPVLGTSAPGDTAYVMHTSGTSGRPKGVVVPHRALVNRLLWGQNTYPLGRGDRVLWHASPGFDFALWEMFAPLAFGATVVVGDPNVSGDPESLAARIGRDAVTTVHFVPRMLELVIPLLSPEDCAQLRYVFSGGATLTAAVRDAWLARFPWTRLYNQYGPTETCIDSTAFLCNGSEGTGEVPIGVPIRGTRVRIVDSSLKPVAVGEPGELLIGGTGLADGYLDAPELTAERFITDPLAQHTTPDRLYRTGDLVRAGEDGLLFHLGRVDRQIQINGVRAELGEIEQALLRYPGIVEAHVEPLSRGPHVVGTVAYVYGAPLSASEVRVHAAAELPATLVPTRVVRLDTPLPRSHKGEVDVQALRAATAGPAPRPDNTEIPGRVTPMNARVFPATAAQSRIYLMPRRCTDDGSFNVMTRLRLTGPLDTARLERALRLVAARHAALRTTFALDGERVVQIVHAGPAPTLLRTFALDDLPTPPPGEDAVEALGDRLIRTSLSLDHGPVFQSTLVRSGELAHDLFLIIDHIVVDERSKAIIINDLATFYADPEVELGPPPQHYDFLDQDAVSEEDLDYWKQRLTSLPQRPFPDVSPHENPAAFRAGIVHFEITPEASAALDRTAAACRATAFSALLAVYYCALWGWTRTADLSMAVITDTRTEDSQFDTVGFFQNPTVMRHTIRPEESFAELLGSVKRTVAGAIAHRRVPLSRIMADLGVGYGNQRNPLYQAGFAYSTTDIDASWRLDGVQVDNVPMSPTDAQLELYLEVKRTRGRYQAEVSHALGVVDTVDAEHFTRLFRDVLDAAVRDPHASVASLLAAAPTHS